MYDAEGETRKPIQSQTDNKGMFVDEMLLDFQVLGTSFGIRRAYIKIATNSCLLQCFTGRKERKIGEKFM